MEEKKVAFITGASRGIGKEIAKEFAQNGYDLVLTYVSNKTHVEELQKEFEDIGSKILLLKADVSKNEEIEEIVKKAIEMFGKIDVLVNNAGITKDNLLIRMKKDEIEDVIDVNLKGTMLVSKQVIPYMMKKRMRKYYQCFFSCRCLWKCGAM